MSKSAPTVSESEEQEQELTVDERAVFDRLADRHDGTEVGQIAEAVLQSSSDESEEARS
ncbi:kinesin [Halorussus salinus]|uniref:kinesin n=1 Tax=Halorussus salinus TaxID=1364935 RepID=UPI0010932CE5|nr:kinesin [Halorussus salinus]